MITIFNGKYGFLSNFYPCTIEYQGITYPSVEHYYVAMKSNNDQMIDGKYYTAGDFRELVSKVTTAGKAKRLGRVIKIRTDWDEKKLGFMEWALRQKFKDPELRDMLLSTGSIQLIEGNYWHDIFWGQCTCEKCANKGKNHLGKLLMQIRSELDGTQKKGLESILF
jgi:ribA/ribD-fused uncharacterized protein